MGDENDCSSLDIAVPKALMSSLANTANNETCCPRHHRESRAIHKGRWWAA